METHFHFFVIPNKMFLIFFLSYFANFVFRNRKKRDSDLANIISGSIKYRRADGHFSEDVGLGHPPAQDISTVGRLCALILSVDEKDINV